MKRLFIVFLFLSTFAKAQVYNVGFYGNSIVNDVGVTTGGYGFVTVCMQILGGTHYTGCKWAQNGYQTGQMLANYSSQIDANCFTSPGSYAANVFVPYEYVNSIATGGESAPQVYAEMKALCLAEKAEGRKVVIPTMIADLNASWSEATRAQLNDSIITNWKQFADTIARIDTIAGMTYADGLHPDNNGHFLMGRNIAYAINGYFYPPSNGGGNTTLPSSSIRTFKVVKYSFGWIGFILAIGLLFSSCKKENLSDTKTQKIKVEWEAESNGAKYTVEASEDGQNFHTIATSIKNVDTLSFNMPKDQFYRIKEEEEGIIHYSKIIKQ